MGSGVVMRIHRVRAEVVVAACDRELIGRELSVGENGRTVQVSGHFYGEREVSVEELLWALERATVANLLGERVLGIAREHGHIGTEATASLGGVPHAEIVAMPG